MDSQPSNVSNISFFHLASVYPKATEAMIESVRKHHPTSYYFLGVDGDRNNYFDIAKKNNCDLMVYQKPIGGPVPPYGYDLYRTLNFLNRFKTACSRCNTSHIMMMEDDVLILKSISINPFWEHSGADTKVGNQLPDSLVSLIETFSNKPMVHKQYGAGGGTIFKVSTFLENYNRIIEWFIEHFEEVQKEYPTIGYIDCFMNVYYWLCGKDISANPYRTDTHNHQPGFDYESFIEKLPNEIELINNYKKKYYE